MGLAPSKNQSGQLPQVSQWAIPASCACFLGSFRLGKPVGVSGPFNTIMTGLRCGEGSPIAWPTISKAVDAFISIEDEDCTSAMRLMAHGSYIDQGVTAGPVMEEDVLHQIEAGAKKMIREDARQHAHSLSITCEKIQQLLKNLLDEELRWKPDASAFSCLEHVCHLRDIEREGYSVRIRRLLNEKDPSLFDIDGDRLAKERNYNDQNLAFAFDEFLQARRKSLGAIVDLSISQLNLSGTLENYGPITLGALLRMMAEHDDEHLRALSDLRSQLMARTHRHR